ncbi:glycoside hydrolase family 18 protein [Exidia glandulosa HHB12029]|uniref:Glycoside hydrolase family 18 protein n=1 Tax=Exidia glandulosa HHB12029 TaxID=1314781 RepID=A0A165FTP0_EXIGL|nr:glycoside hydrolase family 18 protein [Exidia glandulosa HHB12029]
MSTTVSIPTHTTASAPRPHVLYEIHVTSGDDSHVVQRRYSDFLSLQAALGDGFALPPKRVVTTTFVPSAWADDALIEERKAGLYSYLESLLASPEHATSPALLAFLDAHKSQDQAFNPEDAVPSTLSRATALELVQAARADAEVEGALTRPPDWSVNALAPETLWFGKFDIIYFAFATPNSSSTLSFDSGATSILKRLVSAAKAAGKGTRVVLSIGGWGGSKYFSQATSTAANRTKFVNSIVSAINTYGLAGVDIDWEYPNSAGAGNPHSSNDAANLLLFLTSLRTAIGSSKIISAAVPHLPWLGSNGSPLTNVAAYAKQMSWVNIMNYDVWGASSTPGPNAPLGNLCGTSKQPQANAQAAFSQWTKAGFPANKLFLGLPLYGYVSKSTKTTISNSFAPTSELDAAPFAAMAEDEDAVFLDGAHPRNKDADTEIHAEASLTGWYGQQIPFGKLVSSGALKKNADGTYSAAGGFTRGWDNCSTTPFLYNTAQSTFVSYDDPASLAAKAEYAKSKGMAGTFTWSIDEDDIHGLTDAIRTAGGRAPPPSS